MEKKPFVAITVGDPAGIGPEICLEAVRNRHVRDICIPFIIGNASVLHRVAAALGIPFRMPVISLSKRSVLELTSEPALIDPTSIQGVSIHPGTICAEGGMAAYESLVWAVDMALETAFDAVVTAPLNKKSLSLAGVQEHGHTEILARLCGSDTYAMLYWGPSVSVSLATIHCPLSEVPRMLTQERVYHTARLTAETLETISGKKPRIGVLGLNPHSGEHGLFGKEEQEIIMPAIEKLVQEGLSAEGPLSPDTAFIPENRETFDGFVAMYHDQGSIPFKMIHFENGVNHTMGLPVIRTSVDHGTAFDIAWQGKASCESLISAIELAVKLCT